MDPRFRIPAATMLAGLGLWVLLLGVRVLGGVLASAFLAIGVCFVSGALVVFSSFTCQRAGGPAMGQVVRFVLLCAMGVVTLLWVNALAAAMLGLATLIVAGVGVVALTRSSHAEQAHGSECRGVD